MNSGKKNIKLTQRWENRKIQRYTESETQRKAGSDNLVQLRKLLRNLSTKLEAFIQNCVSPLEPHFGSRGVMMVRNFSSPSRKYISHPDNKSSNGDRSFDCVKLDIMVI